MVDESEYSVADYEGKYALPDVEKAPLAIRLIQIQPRKANASPFSSTIELKMCVVDLASSNLLKGESVEPIGRPSVRFDEEMNVERPEEYFGIPRSSMPKWNTGQDEEPTESKQQHRLSRLTSKLTLKAKTPKKDLTIVPLNEIPEGEPKMRNRFNWGNGVGNYVAMSYSWGKREEWEMTEKDKKEAAEQEEEKRQKKSNIFNYDSSDDEEDDTDTQYTDGNVHEVLLDGKRIRIRYNLWAALLAFREMQPFKQGTWLWNDALCINQAATDAGFKERARQIPLMSIIYRQAGNIIVHLGGGYFFDEDTPWVLDYLQGIGANYRTEYYEALDHAEPTIAQSHRQKAKIQLEKSAKEWVEDVTADLQKSARQGDNDYAMISLYDFFNRPYWRRLWIIQELAMAHHSAPILCGDFVTQWRYIRDGALLLSMMANTVRDAMQRALQRANRTMTQEPSFEHVAAIAELSVSGNRKVVRETNELLLLLKPGVMDAKSHSNSLRMTSTGNGLRMPLMKTLPGSPIQQSLTLAADTQCSMDKDRVLGLLAIPALSNLPLRNDAAFGKLLTTDIYINYAKACIKADHSLGIFAFLEGGMSGPDRGRRLPSWCPRFHLKSKIGRIEGNWHPHPRRPKYNRGDSESWEFEEDMAPKFEGEVMTCPGWVIDSVDGLGALSKSDMASTIPGTLFKGGFVPPRFKPDWSDVKDVYEYNNELVMQGVPTRIWSTLVGGTGTHGKKAPDSFSCLLNSFPEELPRNSNFMYKRNWNFLQANRDLPVGGKPLSSYFTAPSKDIMSSLVMDYSNRPTNHDITEAHRAMEARTKFRRLMTTSNRPLMGLVPASTQPGDAVIILWYHSRPLIATMVTDPDNGEDVKFLLKGEAFIPGVMNGELVDSGELEAMPLTNFKFY